MFTLASRPGGDADAFPHSERMRRRGGVSPAVHTVPPLRVVIADE